ncbi:MAG: BrnT family toxin [Bdellovibrionota bacterium]
MAGRIADSRTVYFCFGELNFEWDAGKAERNLAKHGVSFEEAAEVFFDPLLRELPDSGHSEDEERWIQVGYTRSGRLLLVAGTDREGVIRLVSARRAAPQERRDHEETR